MEVSALDYTPQALPRVSTMIATMTTTQATPALPSTLPGAGRLAPALTPRADGPIAQRMLDRILKHHRSAYAFVLSVDFNNTRNMHEARRTAQAIDAFLRQGVTADFEGMEILVRNLAGLRKSDELRDPSILEEFEWAPPEDFVPRDIFRAVVKGAQRRAKYSRTTKPKPTGSNNGAGSDKKGPAKGK